jgi:hypothetical protein
MKFGSSGVVCGKHCCFSFYIHAFTSAFTWKHNGHSFTCCSPGQTAGASTTSLLRASAVAAGVGLACESLIPWLPRVRLEKSLMASASQGWHSLSLYQSFLRQFYLEFSTMLTHYLSKLLLAFLSSLSFFISLFALLFFFLQPLYKLLMSKTLSCCLKWGNAK